MGTLSALEFVVATTKSGFPYFRRSRNASIEQHMIVLDASNAADKQRLAQTKATELVVITTAPGSNFFCKQAHVAGEDLIVLDPSRADSRIRAAPLLAAWDELRRSSGQVSRYNTPASFMNRLMSADHSGVQPFALLLTVDQQLAAVVVGHVGVERTTAGLGPLKVPFARLKTLHVGESGVVHDARHEHLRFVFDRIAKLRTDGFVDVVQWFDVVQDSTVHELLSRTDGFKERSTCRAKNRWQTQILDPVTGERLKHHSSKTRSTQKRRDRKLTEAFDGDVTVETITSGPQVAGFICDASAIVARSYQAGLGIGIRADDVAMRTYLYELAAEGTLRSYLLKAKGRSIAYVQGDLQGGVYTLWATSYLEEFKPLAPGMVLLNRILDALAAEGVPVFDFGWGDSAYKQVLGSHKLDVVDLKIYADRFYPRFAQWFDLGVQAIDTRLRRALASGGAIDRLRAMWRTWVLTPRTPVKSSAEAFAAKAARQDTQARRRLPNAEDQSAA